MAAAIRFGPCPRKAVLARDGKSPSRCWAVLCQWFIDFPPILLLFSIHFVSEIAGVVVFNILVFANLEK